MNHADHVQLVGSLVWSVLGLLIGYGLGRFHGRIERKRAAMPDSTPPTPADRPVWRRRGGLARTALGLVILLLAVGTLIELYRVTDCQARYNASVAQALAARSEQTGAQLDRQIEQLDAQLLLLADYPPDAVDEARRAEGMRRALVYREAAQRNRDSLILLRESRVDNPLPVDTPCTDH